jgi:ParB/RepB/Spo0J family partition protein
MTIRMIPVSQIQIPEWNSRLDPFGKESTEEQRKKYEDEIIGLAASMNVRQLQPVIVEEIDGDPDHFLLVVGSRRLRAAQYNKWTEIQADVRPASSRKARILENVTENAQRADLTQFELARACLQLRDEGMTLKEVSASLGWSVPRVSNLAVTLGKLHPEIATEWQRGSEAATTDFLRGIVKLKPDAQLEAYRAREDLLRVAEEVIEAGDEQGDGEEDETEAGGKSKGKKKADKSDPPYKVDHQFFFDTVRAIQKSKVAGGKLAILCLRYLVGEIDHVPGVIDKPAPAKAEKAA